MIFLPLGVRTMTTIRSIGLRDERRLRRHVGFLHQLLESDEARMRVVGMDRRDATRMTGVPRFEHRERLGTAHLADDDAIGAQAQRRADEPRHVDRLGRAQGHADLATVQRSSRVSSIVSMRCVEPTDDAKLVQQSVRERRLTALCPADNQNVLPRADRVAQVRQHARARADVDA